MQTVTAVKDRTDVPFNAIRLFAAKCYRVDIESIEIIRVEDGHGVHTHDAKCGYVPGNSSSCFRNCDDSDWIVTVSYPCDDKHYNINGYGGCSVTHHEAVYGVLNGKFSLWID